ncbi:hypothetical protein [Plantactinospora sp. B24E8]|uniref:hypothetical protein n=1 Tax=Plantactinospora sp. B24E8 TaxID=3153567 RepID=UPI00325E8ABE
MSEFYISAIPTAVHWQPTSAAAEAAEVYVRRIFPDPDGTMQEVKVEFHDRIAVIHPGENLERITCPRCRGDISLDWFDALVTLAEGEFDNLDGTMPCCGTVLPLDTLDYDWPCGYARFEIGIRDACRPEYEFTEAELAELGNILGHPVRQILAHF